MLSPNLVLVPQLEILGTYLKEPTSNSYYKSRK